VHRAVLPARSIRAHPVPPLLGPEPEVDTGPAPGTQVIRRREDPPRAGTGDGRCVQWQHIRYKLKFLENGWIAGNRSTTEPRLSLSIAKGSTAKQAMRSGCLKSKSSNPCLIARTK